MAGIVAARKTQLGREVTPGTGVAATTIWRGPAEMQDTREPQIIPEQAGVFMPTTRAYLPAVDVEFEFGDVMANTLELPHILEMGLETVTPVNDAPGTGEIYTYTPPLTSSKTIKTYTIEMGNNQKVYEANYCFVSEFTISGNAREGLMMSAQGYGREMKSSTFTGGLSIPNVTNANNLVFGGSKFYIDDVANPIGTTQINGTLLSAELEVNTGLTRKYTADNLFFDHVYFNKDDFSATLNLVFEHNSTADNAWTDFTSLRPRLFRLVFEGDDLGAPGTYNKHTLIIDLAGVYTSYEFGDADGNQTVELEVTGGYDTTASLGLRLIVVNELTSIP